MVGTIHKLLAARTGQEISPQTQGSERVEADEGSNEGKAPAPQDEGRELASSGARQTLPVDTARWDHATSGVDWRYWYVRTSARYLVLPRMPLCTSGGF